MSPDPLEELLRTVEVRLHAVALCEVGHGASLIFPPRTSVVIHFGLEGEGAFELEGRAPAAFRMGDVVIVPGGAQAVLMPQGEPSDGSNSVVDSSELNVDGLLLFRAGEGRPAVRTACAMITPSYAAGVDLFQHLSEPLVHAAEPEVSPAFALMLREVAAPALGARAMIEAAMRLILLMVLRRQLADAGVGGPLFSGLRDPRLVRAVSAIITRPGANHTVETLAREAGMSRPVFSERFTRAFRQTPFEFVQKVRLRHAARLLQVTPFPVKTIAESVGFASRSHFSRAFSAAYGLDPTRYRRAHASE